MIDLLRKYRARHTMNFTDPLYIRSRSISNPIINIIGKSSYIEGYNFNQGRVIEERHLFTGGLCSEVTCDTGLTVFLF